MSGLILAVAYFAGGCFWCMEEAFQDQPGVTDVVSGFMGGHVPNPTYKQVTKGETGHTEAIQVHYDPQQITYQKLLEVFWHNVDPTTKDRQFCDVGPEYRAGIYPQASAEHQLAQRSKQLVAAKFPQNYVEIKPATAFYPAEDYHQNYYQKKPWVYKFYKNRCARAQTLQKLWGSHPVFDWQDPASSPPPSGSAAEATSPS